MKKFKEGFLVFILIICIIMILLIIYATFIYDSSKYNNEAIKKIINNINSSELTKEYNDKSEIFIAKLEKNNIVFEITSGNNKTSYEMEYKDSKIVININDRLPLEKAMNFTQIIVNAIGINNNYKEGEFIETVNKVFNGNTVKYLIYANNKVEIDTNNIIEPIENNDKKSLTQNKKIYYGNFENHLLTESNYVIDFGDYLVTDIKIEHNKTYNIAKVILDIADFSEIKSNFIINSKLLGNNNFDLISESNYEYKNNNETNITIKVNHLLKNNINFENVKYININIVKK